MAPLVTRHARLRFGFPKALSQNSAESRVFPSRPTLYGGSLYPRRLNGGGGSPGRTRLWGRFLDLWGKCREIVRNWTHPSDQSPRIRSLFAVVATDSRRSGTGNSFHRAEKFWHSIPASKLRRWSQPVRPRANREMRVRPTEFGRLHAPAFVPKRAPATCCCVHARMESHLDILLPDDPPIETLKHDRSGGRHGLRPGSERAM